MTFIDPNNTASGTGTYALILQAGHEDTICIGRLGQLHLIPGFYVYVGSAFGPGGLAARIEHHRKLSYRPHWHIDYIRPFVRVCDVWFSYDPARREHTWAATINGLSDLSVPLRGFGSSDCGCAAHLFYTPLVPEFRSFTNKLYNKHAKHKAVYRCAHRD